MSSALATDVGLVAKLFRGFADPTRLAILAEIADGDRRVTDLVARLGGRRRTSPGTWRA